MWTGVSQQLIPIQLEDCDILCPLKAYEAIMEPYIPDSKAKKCLGLKHEY